MHGETRMTSRPKFNLKSQNQYWKLFYVTLFYLTVVMMTATCKIDPMFLISEKHSDFETKQKSSVLTPAIPVVNAILSE